MILAAQQLRRQRGFTLVELLVTIGVIAILASLLFPALSAAKAKANRIKCMNNLRQVNLALTMYAGDNDGQIPPRRRTPNTWVDRLLPYYKVPAVLRCPKDSLTENRSYIINGFDDYFESHLAKADYARFKLWMWPHGMRETDIPQPSETITFGEKRAGNKNFHMDFYQGSGNDVDVIDQARHGSKANTGGSNFAFADGSIRLLPRGQSVTPANLWAVTDGWRAAPVPPGVKL